MTLKEIVTELNSIAIRQPNVHKFIISGDIYELNDTDVEYAAFCATQQNVSENDSFRTYNFNLFYVDRLDDSKDNLIDVQSHAIEVLDNIVNTFIDNHFEVEITSKSFTTFTQRFLSLCAGAYCTINISIPVNNCVEIF